MGSIIKRSQVRLTEGPESGGLGAATASLSADGAPGACASARSARLVRADGRVRAIEVTCSCGTTTVLEVDYDVVPDVEDKETS